MKRFKILVAEDDDLVAELIVQVLARNNFDVVRSADGEAALAQVIQFKPDAIVLDTMMPGLDGTEVLQELAKSLITRHIPVMILSARSNAADMVHGFDFGARDFMAKPFKPEELVTRLRRMLMSAKDWET
ncbi:MAG: response regulator [Rhodospirillaceae bacterium]|nr:response regulator [Rhodospirillaceae bacterium]